MQYTAVSCCFIDIFFSPSATQFAPSISRAERFGPRSVNIDIELDDNEAAELDHFVIKFYNASSRGRSFDTIVC